jgi:hypothetical protein
MPSTFLSFAPQHGHIGPESDQNAACETVAVVNPLGVTRVRTVRPVCLFQFDGSGDEEPDKAKNQETRGRTRPGKGDLGEVITPVS